MVKTKYHYVEPVIYLSQNVLLPLQRKKLRKSLFFCIMLLNLSENAVVLNLVAPVF